MSTYRAMWLFACWCLGLVGAGASFALSFSAMVGVFLGAAFVTGVVALDLAISRERTKVRWRDIVGFVVRSCLIGGTTCLAVVGLTTLIGPWVLLVVAFIAALSPHALCFYGRCVRHRSSTSGRTQQSEPITPPGPPILEEKSSTGPPFAELRSLSDRDLCQAWRASFSALQEASSPSQRLGIVEARQGFLDEFERRNPEGLMAWLASGARAAANPSRFVVGSPNPRHRPIDWDDLIPRQDR